MSNTKRRISDVETKIKNASLIAASSGTIRPEFERMMPLDVMNYLLRFCLTKAEEAEAEGGISNLIWAKRYRGMAAKAARNAAPYCHPRLAALRVEQEHEDTHETIDVDDYLEEEAKSLGLQSFRQPKNGKSKRAAKGSSHDT